MEHNVNQIIIEGLLVKKHELEQRRDKLRLPLEKIERDLEHIMGTLALYDAPIQETALVSEFPLSKLAGLTQLQAIVTIAKHNAGIVTAQDAKRLLINAGLMRKTKNSTTVVHSTIIRSDKFQRVAPGEHRLKENNNIAIPFRAVETA